MPIPKELSSAHDKQVQKLKEELKMMFEKEPIQHRPVDKGVKSLIADFLTHEEKIIVHLSSLAIQFYRLNEIGLYQHVLEVRDALMSEIDDKQFIEIPSPE